jgi:hypothetical protein
VTRVFIQAVPWIPERTKRAVQLMRQTDGQIIWDQDHNPYHTFLDLLRAVGDGPAIMLEDDVDLPPDWREKVEHEVTQRPTEVIQMFTIRMDSPPQSQWSTGKSFWCHQCWYMPAGFAKALLEYAPEYERGPKYHAKPLTDGLTNQFMRDRRMKYWHRVPSAVQHLPFGSLIQDNMHDVLREGFQEGEHCAGPEVFIPRTLHQIWVGSEPPEMVLRAWKEWDRRLDKTWEVLRWTDEVVKESFPEVAHLGERLSPRGLSDLLRIHLLKTYGGVYADYDAYPLRDMAVLAGERPAWITAQGYSALLGASVDHPGLQKMWDIAVERIRKGKTNEFSIAGPKVWQRYSGIQPDLRAVCSFSKHVWGAVKEMHEPNYQLLRQMYPEAVALTTVVPTSGLYE